MQPFKIIKFWMDLTVAFLAITMIFLTSNFQFVSSCNETVCSSIVGKCRLINACDCTSNNYTCNRECFNCLSYLYDECCSCVGMCSYSERYTHKHTKSQVGELSDSAEILFKALTEQDDILDRWTVSKFPVDVDQSKFLAQFPEEVAHFKVESIGRLPVRQKITVNCTVLFLSKCASLNKCKNSCHSMGASYFRWFHDGCCECVGATCMNYGIDESRCSQCPVDDDAEDDLEEFEDDFVDDAFEDLS